MDHSETHAKLNLNRMAASATLHCLSGCAIGEVAGMMLGAAFSWHNGLTIVVSIALAFLFGFSLSLRPLLKHGMSFRAALPVVLAADTLSITVMEITDNTVMALVPGALDAMLNDVLFWLALVGSLVIAYIAAYPVNRYLLSKGRGHALTHAHHDH